jgi:hypothetical protein
MRSSKGSPYSTGVISDVLTRYPGGYMKKINVLPIVLCAMLSSCAVYDVPNHYQGQQYDQRYHDRGQQYGDRDRDGVPNQNDRDRDGDGVRNNQDRRPNDPTRY